MRIVYYSDIPTANTSFGLQGDMLASLLTAAGHEVYYVGLELNIGRPFQYHGYTVHPNLRTSSGSMYSNFVRLVGEIDAHVVISHLDVQQTRFLENKLSETVWIENIPVDIEEPDPDLIKGAEIADIKVSETKIGAAMLRKSGCADVYYIPCMVNEEFFKPLPDKERKGFKKEVAGLKDDDYIILFVGRPNWRKNFPTMLATISELVNRRGHKNIKFVMHSDMNDPASNTNFSQWFKALDITSNVIFTNNDKWDKGVDPLTLSHIYNMADVYFQPHGGEGFGITMAEAMACGVPVVATNYTSSKEMIGDNERGYRIPFRHSLNMMGIRRPVPDTMECADILEKYINGEIDAKKQGKLAAEFAIAEYSRPVVFARWKQLLKSIEYQRLKIE
jgi:glycosyltransferase involved in cell wall biosynthesis